MLLKYDRIIFMAPMQWIDIPAMGRYWLEQVFATGFAFNVDRSAGPLAGRKLIIIQTAGASSACFVEGAQGSAEQLGLSFKAIARYCKM